MKNNSILREIKRLREQVGNNPFNYLPVLILDEETYEYVKPQLDFNTNKRGVRKLKFQDGTNKFIKDSTVIIVDDVSE